MLQYAHEGKDFLLHIIRKRNLIYELTRRDFQAKYVKNILGLLWAVLDPLFFLLILWFVFSVGLRTGRTMSIPFVVYLITGQISFDLVSGTLLNATHVIKDYSFLIQKVNFRAAILPIIKILSGLILHCIMLVIAVIIILANGIYPSLYWLQVLYYIVCSIPLLVGLSWITSSVSLFMPDIGNIVTIATRFLFFGTPVFWQLSLIPKQYHVYLKLNPIFYIVNGYRESFFFETGFWQHPYLSLYYWSVTGACFIIGVVVFKKLRPHFADVL
jgi:ABC-type polysaccharide/polyol phosphate export permease